MNETTNTKSDKRDRGNIETIVSYTNLLLNFGEVRIGLSPSVLEGLSPTGVISEGFSDSCMVDWKFPSEKLVRNEKP